MRNADTFRQYTWLVNTIQRSGGITFERIGQMWIDSDLNEGKPLSRTTFYRLRQAIDDMFGIRIESDNQHRYYISNPETLYDNSTQNWMLRTLTVSSLLMDGLSIKDQIVLEDIPAGLEHLETIIDALKNRHALRMGYKKFTDSEPYTTLIEPYCLKLFRQRWYLLGKSEKKGHKMAIYALDRITNCELQKDTFRRNPKFNLEKMFSGSYGIIVEDIPVQSVWLKVDAYQANYLRSLPLHSSQIELERNDVYSKFALRVRPTYDFKQKILSLGATVEVLKPETLRADIKGELNEMLN